MTPELTPQEIEAIKKEAESILKITYIHHSTEVNPDDNWADWETCKKDGSVEMVLEAMTKQATSERLKHRAEILAYRYALDHADEVLAHLEDFTHGKDGMAITAARYDIQQTLNKFK